MKTIYEVYHIPGVQFVDKYRYTPLDSSNYFEEHRYGHYINKAPYSKLIAKFECKEDAEIFCKKFDDVAFGKYNDKYDIMDAHSYYGRLEIRERNDSNIYTHDDISEYEKLAAYTSVRLSYDSEDIFNKEI